MVFHRRVPTFGSSIRPQPVGGLGLRETAIREEIKRAPSIIPADAENGESNQFKWRIGKEGYGMVTVEVPDFAPKVAVTTAKPDFLIVARPFVLLELLIVKLELDEELQVTWDVRSCVEASL